MSRRVAPLRVVEGVLRGLVLFAVVGSVLAIGSVHPWAYQALWVTCGIIGLLVATRAALILHLRRSCGGPRTIAVLTRGSVSRGGRKRKRRDEFWRLDLGQPLVPRGPLFLPGLVFVVWCLIQLIPWTPAGRRLTIAPADTVRGLAFVVAFLVLHAAAGIVLERDGGRSLFRRALVLLGTALGFIALIQAAAGATKIYGVFAPWEPSTSIFGPFVNKNHFAAYMLLLAPLAMERLRSAWARYSERIGRAPNLRRRIAVLDTREGTAFLYALLPTAVIVGGLVGSTSRGALLAFVASLVIGGVALARRRGPKIGLIGLAFGFMILAWFGVERLEERFVQAKADAPSRTLVWSDTVARMGDYWLTGTGFNTFGKAFSRDLPFVLPKGATAWPQEVMDAAAQGGRPATRIPTKLGTTSWFREAHNDYLQLLAETGIPGLATGLWAAVCVLLVARQRAWLLTSVIALLLHLIVDFDFQIPAIVALFVTLTGWPPHRPRQGSDGPGDEASAPVDADAVDD